jgi:hypothetical protein
MVDSFTKLLEIEFIIGKEAKQAVQAFHNAWICRYGRPSTIVCDQGSEFMGEFHKYATEQGIYISRTRAYHPQANGKGEAAVKTAKKMLLITVDDFPAFYPERLPDVRLAYMARFHSAVGSTPFQLLTGRAIRLFEMVPNSQGPSKQPTKLISRLIQRCKKDPELPKLELDEWEQLYMEELGKKIARSDADADKRLNKAADKYYTQAQARFFKTNEERQDRPIRKGDKVLAYNRPKKGNKVFQEVKIGPYTVLGRDGPMLILRGEGGTKWQKALDHCTLYRTLHTAIREFGSAGSEPVPQASE